MIWTVSVTIIGYDTISPLWDVAFDRKWIKFSLISYNSI